MKSVIKIKKVSSSYHSRWYGHDLTEISSLIGSTFYCPHIFYSGCYSLTQLPRVKCSKTDEQCPVDISGNVRDCYKVKGNK